MNEKKVGKTEVDTLLVELLLEDEEKQNNVSHTADDNQKDEED